MATITLTNEQEIAFSQVLKRSVYKELYKKNMLTETQLNKLLNH